MRVMLKLAVVSAVALAVCLGWAAHAAEQPMIGEQAPPFELESLGGETVSLAGLRGKLVVIHFGTDW